MLFGAVLSGGLVALSLGIYGQVHSPTGQGIAAFGFPAVLPMKAWFATAAFVLGVLQIASALLLWGKVPWSAPAPGSVATVHRWLGTTAFLFTLPVAYHCLWSLGYRSTDTRVLVHSTLGCLFYGAFATKMLVLRIGRVPDSALPLAGGVLFALLVGIWSTSSWWFFQTFGLPGF